MRNIKNVLIPNALPRRKQIIKTKKINIFIIFTAITTNAIFAILRPKDFLVKTIKSVLLFKINFIIQFKMEFCPVNYHVLCSINIIMTIKRIVSYI